LVWLLLLPLFKLLAVAWAAEASGAFDEPWLSRSNMRMASLTAGRYDSSLSESKSLSIDEDATAAVVRAAGTELDGSDVDTLDVDASSSAHVRLLSVLDILLDFMAVAPSRADRALLVAFELLDLATGLLTPTELADEWMDLRSRPERTSLPTVDWCAAGRSEGAGATMAVFAFAGSGLDFLRNLIGVTAFCNKWLNKRWNKGGNHSLNFHLLLKWQMEKAPSQFSYPFDEKDEMNHVEQLTFRDSFCPGVFPPNEGTYFDLVLRCWRVLCRDCDSFATKTIAMWLVLDHN
jgi:hypothetical protein